MKNAVIIIALIIILIHHSGYSQISPVIGSPETRMNETVWVNRFFSYHAEKKIIPDIDDAYGVAFTDLDGDYLADLYIVRFRNLNRLLVNPGNRKDFMDYTIRSGLGGNLMPKNKVNLELGNTVADFNNDGVKDPAIVGWGETTSIFERTDTWSYEKISIPGADHLDGNCAIWGDIDNDGDLDLFITDEHYSNHLFINEGTSNLYAADSSWGVFENSTSQGAAFGDLNGDGWIDLYVCNWFSPDFIYLNKNGETFERLTLPLTHLSDGLNSNSVSFGDLDNDGDLDLVVSDRESQSAIYINYSSPGDISLKFVEMSDSMGVDNPYPAYGALIADFNNDGWLDIYFTNLGPNQFYLNNGNHTFKRLKENDHFSKRQDSFYSTGSAVADYDMDGDLDLIVANKDTMCFLYENPLQTGAWIRIRLEGTTSNWDGIGSNIWLYSEEDPKNLPELCGYRQYFPGNGYLSTSESVVHFGVDPNKIYRVIVQFPSGKEIEKRNLYPGHVYLMQEESGFKRWISRSAQKLNVLIHKETFLKNVIILFLFTITVSLFVIMGQIRYKWSKKQSILYYLGIVLVLYLFSPPVAGNLDYSARIMQWSIITLIVLLLVFIQERMFRMRKKRFAYRKNLYDFSDRLFAIKEKSDLIRHLVVTLYKTLHLKFCVYIELNDTLKLSDFEGDITFLNRKSDYFEATDGKKINFQLRDTAHIILDPDYQSLGIPGVPDKTTLVILKMKEKITGLLLMGRSQKSIEMGNEDIELFKIISNQASVAMENIEYIDQSKTLVKQITENTIRQEYIDELERKNQALEELYQNLKKTQAQLIHSEKMSGLGQLVAGIAHELNNPISFVYANMKELKNNLNIIETVLSILDTELNSQESVDALVMKIKNYKSDENINYLIRDLPDLIKDSLEGSNRVKEIVQTLKNFARIDESKLKKVNIHQGIESTLLLLKNQIKNRIMVHKDYGKIPEILCQPGQINQVFMNILMNALQAISGTGNIWISTATENDTVIIMIRDDGKGIPESIRSKIFDPFFTTRNVGEGTGLGLSISYTIIGNHDGEIFVRSKEGTGTTFTIKLPLRKKESDEEKL